MAPNTKIKIHKMRQPKSKSNRSCKIMEMKVTRNIIRWQESTKTNNNSTIRIQDSQPNIYCTRPIPNSKIKVNCLEDVVRIISRTILVICCLKNHYRPSINITSNQNYQVFTSKKMNKRNWKIPKKNLLCL